MTNAEIASHLYSFLYAAGCVNVNVMNINIFREKNDKKNACCGDSGSIKQMV